MEGLLGSEAAAVDARSNKTPIDRLRRFRRRVLIALFSGVRLLSVAGFLGWRFAGPTRGDVNFITDRFDATVWLDDEPVRDPEGTPYTTRCTVPNVSANLHQVVFKHPALADLEVGRIDFAKTREIVARRPEGVGDRLAEP